MLKTRRNSPLLPCAALAAVLCLGTAGRAVADQAIVVAATAPGLTIGQVIEDGAAVRMPEGSNALFLFSSGRTVTVKGPYEGPLDRLSGGKETQGRLSGLFAADRFAQNELGAARNLGTPKTRSADELPAIDASLPGVWCVRAGHTPSIQRPIDPAFNPTVLKPAAGKATTVSWGGAAATQPWPPALPLNDGAEIQVRNRDQSQSHNLVMRVVDDGGDPGLLAVGLVKAGCRRQAEAVLASIGETTVPLDLYLSSERGLYPTYHAGEPVRLVLQTNRDAHLYCYLRRRADLIPIFPSPDSGGSMVKGSMPLTFPGDRMPLPLAASEPGGDSEVRCFAADRDLAADLPSGMQAFKPLGADAVAKLEATLDGLRQTRLVVAQIVLRVK
ncbi:MAG TPA: DUF4384 domain-containing protein [Skermanella sp.]|jgi:hypothetical protein|nr:DUF4384 domain-containing protein [Skermanella sp.]